MARSRGRPSGGGERSVEQGPTKPLAARNRAEASGSERRQEGHKEVPHAHKQAATAPVLPSRRSPPSPPPLPAAAEALLLPGLDEDSPPGGGPCHLPLENDRTQTSTFGNPFASADSLRVTSISRSAAARRTSQLRLVMQADAADGRRLSRLSPQQRPVARVRTLPLQRRGKGRRTDAPAPGGGENAAAEVQHPVAPVAALSSASLPAEASSASSSEAPAQEGASSSNRPASCDAAVEATAESQEAPQPPPPQRQPLGAPSSPAQGSNSCSAQEAAEGQAQAAGSASAGSPRAATEAEVTTTEAEGNFHAASNTASEGGSGHAAAASAYSGVPAEAEAEAMLGGQAPPAWLQQQGACRNEPGLHFVEHGPAGPAMSSHAAAASWRCMWLSGLQWHNACRAGQPIRAGSPWPFVPLDPNEPLLELFMFHTAVMPEHVIAGAARFEDILLGDAQLHAAAVEAGVFSWGAWAVPAPGGGYSLLEGGRTMALPVTLRCAPPHTVALFLACVWHEANRAEALAHATYTFTASGERVADERSLKWPLAELRHWMRLAVGGCKRQAEDLLAALAHVSCFGIE
ncbi:hypothetical protein ABPG77_002020 [Micractinium sp. CCAP 211/92]